MFIPMIDTLIYNNDIEDYDNVMREMLDKLEQKKQTAKAALTENKSMIVSITIGEMTFEVLSNGKKGYSYILHNGFYEIDLAQYRSRNKDFNPVFIKVKSEALWALGFINAFQQLQDWQNQNFGTVINNKITRIDLCCHTDKFRLQDDDINNFKGQFYTDCIYRYRRNISSMNFGSSATGKVYCRIYDKVLEIEQKKQKTWFFKVWKDAGLNPNKVWNIEFQILRDFLVERNINDVYDTYEYIGTIWKYCTENWLVKIIRDDENVSRCSIDPFWKVLQKAFEKIEYKPFVKRENQLKADAMAMVPNAYGYVTTYAAKNGMSDINMVLRSLMNAGESYLKTKGKTFKGVVKKKSSLINVNYGNIEEPMNENMIELTYESEV